MPARIAGELCSTHARAFKDTSLDTGELVMHNVLAASTGEPDVLIGRLHHIIPAGAGQEKQVARPDSKYRQTNIDKQTDIPHDISGNVASQNLVA